MALPKLVSRSWRAISLPVQTTVELMQPAAEPVSAIGGRQFIRVLDFSIEYQQHSQWCWAAVSVSVSCFYNNASGWTQCDVANQELKQNTCCVNGDSDACNQTWYLERALSRTDNFNFMLNGKVDFNFLQAEIENTQPLGCRIGWNSGGGHFVVIYGYLVADDGTLLLDIGDPFSGTLHNVRFDDLANDYEGQGTWTHSYITTA